MSPVVLAVKAKPRGVAEITLEGVETDEASTCLLPLESVVTHQIRSGASIVDETWREVVAEGHLLLATRRGLDLLARRMRTERELRRTLRRTYEERAVDGAIERLRALGYLDDAAWAQQYVASARSADRGRALLRQEMRQRGVHDRTVASVLEAHDDAPAAHAAARKRARAASLQRLEPEQRRRRLYDYLRRRGFSNNVAQQVMETALAEADHDE